MRAGLMGLQVLKMGGGARLRWRDVGDDGVDQRSGASPREAGGVGRTSLGSQPARARGRESRMLTRTRSSEGIGEI